MMLYIDNDATPTTRRVKTKQKVTWDFIPLLTNDIVTTPTYLVGNVQGPYSNETSQWRSISGDVPWRYFSERTQKPPCATNWRASFVDVFVCQTGLLRFVPPTDSTVLSSVLSADASILKREIFEEPIVWGKGESLFYARPFSSAYSNTVVIHWWPWQLHRLPWSFSFSVSFFSFCSWYLPRPSFCLHWHSSHSY